MKRTDKQIKAAKTAKQVAALRNAPHAKPNGEVLPGEFIKGLTGWERNAAFKNMKMK